MGNDDLNLKQHQYLTLRQEISDCKTRAFWILILGIGLVVLAAYLASAKQGALANAAIPVVLLVLVMAYAMEQNAIIRAGRFLREHVEPGSDAMGWENWLESNVNFRDMDRYFFAGFIISFLIFYLAASWLALDQLNLMQSPMFARYWAVVYGLGGLCVFVVLLRHWRSCTSTK